MKRLLFVTGLILLISSGHSFAQESDYYGFRCLDFKFEGRDAKIVFPAKAEPQRHWIWRARFWGHEPQTEIALLKKGFHVVYVDAADLCGNSEAVKLWNRYYDYLTATYKLNEKAVLEGFSRGGLYIYNWGSENTSRVACIYADAPVCDLRSWPGGKGKGAGSPADWKLHLQAYGQTEETINDFKGMPVYNSVKLAEAGVPVLHVCGAADDVVPVEENTYVLEKAYKAAGGNIKIIMKEGIGHHPHSLKDPAPIVRFILSNTSPELLDTPIPYEAGMEINYRGNLENSRLKFEKEKTGRVVFLGGSITANKGWRDLVAADLQKRFPGTVFEFINAGIPSLGSTPGSMRFSRDVLSKGKVDILFTEAAVNDATNGCAYERQLRGMEGIVNQALRSNREMDIIMLHFADQNKMADYNNNKVPVVIQQHEKVAEYYNISSINLAKEVNNRVLNGEFTWRDDFKNLHPSPFGQELYFKTISHFFDVSWKNSLAENYIPHLLPEKPLDTFSYVDGRFIEPAKAKRGEGWQLIEKWKPADKVSTRAGFVDCQVVESKTPGAELKLKFKGRAIGIFVTSGPDAGIIEYSIDGSAFKKTDQFTEWSTQLYLPWLIMLEDELKSGNHTLVIRIAGEKNEKSTGNVCRIHHFAVN
jgi:pimeloyl-ACP methyl ester carboxylesterase/lysophospholipase L1-like esterase